MSNISYGNQLRPVDKIEIVSLMDNYIDMLSVIKRPEAKRIWDWVGRNRAGYPVAEHGFSMLVNTYIGSKKQTILLDAGFEDGLTVKNMERMCIDVHEIQEIVLSHGHMDHTGGLVAVLKKLGRSIPVYLHERAFLPRGWQDPNEPDSEMVRPPPCPSRREMESQGAEVFTTNQPRLIAGDTILMTGEIPRKTDFEPGYPDEWVFEDGRWKHDPRVIDDQALVVNLKGKGLVVLTGCGHSGIINTLDYAVQLAGLEKIYGVLGGLHLSGSYYEKNIPATVKEMKRFSPNLLVPCHCTGWLAQKAFHQAFPDSFILNSVGNQYSLECD